MCNLLIPTTLSHLDGYLLGHSPCSVTEAIRRVKLALSQHFWFQDQLLNQWYTTQVRKASLSPQCYPICPWDTPVECTLSVLEGNNPSQVAQLIRQPIKTQTGHVQSQQHLNIRYERPSKGRDKKDWLLFWNRISASVAEVKGDHQSLWHSESYFPQKCDDSTTERTTVM